MMKRMVACLAVAAAFVFTGVNASAKRGLFLEESDKTVLDEQNYLFFESVKRFDPPAEPGKKSTTFERFVRLHVHRDGEEQIIDVVDPEYSEKETWRYPLISPTSLTEIRYKDKDNVWLISRGAHRGSRALLFNMKTRKAVYRYDGRGFSISPEADLIAYYLARDMPMERNAVFVHDLIVFPETTACFPADQTEAELVYRRSRDGVPFAEFMKEYPKHEAKSLIEWTSNDTFEFTVRRLEEATSATLKCVVSGLSMKDGKVDAAGVQVKTTPVAAEQAAPEAALLGELGGRFPTENGSVHAGRYGLDRLRAGSYLWPEGDGI